MATCPHNPVRPLQPLQTASTRERPASLHISRFHDLLHNISLHAQRFLFPSHGVLPLPPPPVYTNTNIIRHKHTSTVVILQLPWPSPFITFTSSFVCPLKPPTVGHILINKTLPFLGTTQSQCIADTQTSSRQGSCVVADHIPLSSKISLVNLGCGVTMCVPQYYVRDCFDPGCATPT